MSSIHSFKENLVNFPDSHFSFNIKDKRLEKTRKRIEKAAHEIDKFYPKANSLELGYAKRLITRGKGIKASHILLKLGESEGSPTNLTAIYLHANLMANGCGDLQQNIEAAETSLNKLTYKMRIEEAALKIAKFHPHKNSLELAYAKCLLKKGEGKKAAHILLKLGESKDSTVNLEAIYLYANLMANGCGDLPKDTKTSEMLLNKLAYETLGVSDFLKYKAKLTLAQILQETDTDLESVVSIYEEIVSKPLITWETRLQAKFGLAKLLLRFPDPNSQFKPLDLLLDVARDKAAILEVVEAQLYLAEMCINSDLPKEIENTETKEFILKLLKSTASNQRHAKWKDSVQLMIELIKTHTN